MAGCRGGDERVGAKETQPVKPTLRLLWITRARVTDQVVPLSLELVQRLQAGQALIEEC